MIEENAYEQCHNCLNKQFELLGLIKCKSEGMVKVCELKKLKHCAAQHQKYFITEVKPFVAKNN